MMTPTDILAAARATSLSPVVPAAVGVALHQWRLDTEKADAALSAVFGGAA